MLLTFEIAWKRIKRETGLSEKNAKAKLTGLPTFQDGARTKFYCTSIDAVIQKVNTPPVIEKNIRPISPRKRERIQQYGKV
jgi:hypothetical protein